MKAMSVCRGHGGDVLAASKEQRKTNETPECWPKNIGSNTGSDIVIKEIRPTVRTIIRFINHEELDPFPVLVTLVLAVLIISWLVW